MQILKLTLVIPVIIPVLHVATKPRHLVLVALLDTCQQILVSQNAHQEHMEIPKLTLVILVIIPAQHVMALPRHLV